MPDSVIYEYDEAGRLKKLVFDNDDEVEYQLDEAGNREEVETTIAS